MPPMRIRATRVVGRALRVGVWVLAGAPAAVGVATAHIAVVALALSAALAGGLACFVAVRGPDVLGARQARVATPVEQLSTGTLAR